MPAKKNVSEELKDAVKTTRSRVKKAAEETKDALTVAEIETKKAVRKAGRKAQEVKAAVEEAAKPALKSRAAKTKIVIQSPLGGEITPEEIAAKVGKVDAVYVRVDQNKAYWVRGEEVGNVDLW